MKFMNMFTLFIFILILTACNTITNPLTGCESNTVMYHNITLSNGEQHLCRTSYHSSYFKCKGDILTTSYIPIKDVKVCLNE